MDSQLSSIEKVVSLFRRLPGVGEKSAQRFTYFFLNAPKEEGLRFVEAMKHMITETKTCSQCFNKTDSDPCKICSDSDRLKGKLCVVENPLDVQLIEDTSIYNGLYFVLGGVIDPTNGIGPDELLISDLIAKIRKMSSELESIELIFAFAPSLQSDVTINYINKKIASINVKSVKSYKLAQGLQTGADLQYTDSSTLGKALIDKVEL